MFPKCQPTTTSGRGAYTLPFLTYTDIGTTVQKQTPKNCGKTPHLHASCLSKTPSDNPKPVLLYPPQLAQKEVVSHPKYNHQTQLTESGPVHMFHIPGCPMVMSDKTLAKVQNGNFFALARTITQDTGNMPLIQGTQWATLQVKLHRSFVIRHDLPNAIFMVNLRHLVNHLSLCALEISICTHDNRLMLQDTLKTIGCDHRTFNLTSHWSLTAELTGHKPAIHETVFKQIGEFSLPLKAGIKMMLFPLEEIKCSYPGPTVGGIQGLPCNTQVACEFFRVIGDNVVCSTPSNDLGIHVNFGPSQEGMCSHFICNQCLSYWHKDVNGKLPQSLGSPSGSKTPMRCFIPSCDCTVGDPLILEETMQSLRCNFISNAKYSKSPMKRPKIQNVQCR